MHSTVRLAQALAGFNADQLERLLTLRGTDPDVPHLTELAISLLKPESLTRVLRSLTITDLQALRDGTPANPDSAERLRDLALTVDDAPLAEVTVMLDSLIAEHGGLPERDTFDLPEAREPAPDWAHRAFLESQQAVLTLRVAQVTPIKLTRSGSVSKVAAKLLSEETFAHAEHTTLVIKALQTIEALVPNNHVLQVTPQGVRWSEFPHAPRWISLAAGILRRMPELLRQSLILSGTDVRHAATTVFPALFPLASRTTRDEVQAFVTLAEHFAVTSHGVLTEPAALLLSQGSAGIEPSIEAARQAFPQAVQGVYLQPDLSVIAPGPVEPRLGLRLLELADLTAPGLATSFTLSERSLSRALDHGWSVDEIRDFFTTASLTPIPQPLEYLLQDLAHRHGTIEVAALNTPDGASVVRVRDDRVARELLADARLQILGLTAKTGDTHTLSTRMSVDHVVSILTDARYPATRVRGAGTPPRKTMTDGSNADPVTFIRALESTLEDASPAWAPETAARLAEAQNSSGALDIVPVLELAARTGETLSITVSDGKREHTLNLQPLSIAKGRLRALDPRAQLERTVSIRAITRVETIHN